MPVIAAISEALEAHVQAGDTVGCVAVVADHHGTLHQSAHGLRAAGGAQPMTLDSVFQIASMTKAIGCAALMRLVEQGRCSLDDDAGALLPDLGALPVLDGFDGDTPRFRPRRRPVTLGQLASHTAGLGYEMWNADQLRLLAQRGVKRRDAGRAGLANFPFLREPGERWEYSVAIDWIGIAIEEIAGEPIREFLAREILGPLGMTSTDVTLTEAMRPRLVSNHRPGEDGRLAPAPGIGEYPDGFFAMGGCMSGTAPDYARFARMILRDGELDGVRVFAPETVRAMSASIIGDLRVRNLPSALPMLTAPLEIFPGVEKTHTPLFMRVEQDVPGMRRAGTLFWAGLFNTHYWIDPASGLAAVLMMQQSPFLSPPARAAFESFERAVYRELS
ncbi:serine hydrolase [Albimonas sp. CAU 1670]|uniref:serine hydrolase domain-containing protein n=1 Tax=Albimonas sp. CAU 1670 TaxID=3032599 RepID=UPI0023DC6E1D|nr:serine hydrolase domain-containing protein [Albimonas sp. CAU 1670]MDF2234656.1 serine hydrolase [Albimonas sp. CAU 1670]